MKTLHFLQSYSTTVAQSKCPILCLRNVLPSNGVFTSDGTYFQKIRPHNLAPPLSAATAAVIMGSAELAMLPSSPSFAATISGAFNPQILVVDVRKSSTDQTEANGEGFE